MITLFHVGPKGFNVGNHAISMGLRGLVREAVDRVVNWISIPATSRYETQQRSGLTARTVHEINQFGDGVIVGGGNLYENGELDLDLNALEALEVPLLVFSLSWGRIYNRRRELVPRTDAMAPAKMIGLNARADISLARDQATFDHLHSLGASEVRLGGCPTTMLDEWGTPLPDLPEVDLDSVFVSVRNPDLMNIPLGDQRRTTEDITRLVGWCRDLGMSPRLLCHDHRDIAYAASLGDVEWVYTENVSQYLALLAASRFVLSYRLHAALPLLAYRRPFIKLSYDERSLSLMDTIGLGDWNIDVVKTDDVLSAVDDRYGRLNDLEDLVARSQPTRDALATTMREAMSEFADLVTEYRKSTGSHRL